MSQQSSLTQSAHSVRQVLTAYTYPVRASGALASGTVELLGGRQARDRGGGCG